MARVLFTTLGASVAVAAILVAAGCGSSGDDSKFGDGTSSGGSGANGGDGFGTTGGSGTSGGTSGGASGGVGSVGGVSPNSACATSSAGADAPPVYLVFMIDKSGSMGNSKQAGQNLSVRWQPVVSGLENFFGDAANANVHASLDFFPQSLGSNAECQESTYSTPVVDMAPLPNAAPYTSAFNANSPGGGTPTLPAVKGAIDYAKQVKTSLTHGEKVAIVLATDGDPNDCATNPNNTLAAAQEVAAAAATVASEIPTYVIGVGPDTTNLDTIAQGGGTGKAIMIATNNTTQVSSDLRNAIGKIKAAQLGCTYTMPAPPSGQTLDVNAVNVDYTPGGGAAKTLPYSADCADTGGWHYDNTSAPSQIVMCSSICSTLQADTSGGKVDIIFGCTTNVTPGGQPPAVK